MTNLDATNGGFLDVFEPANYEELLNEVDHSDQAEKEKIIATAKLA